MYISCQEKYKKRMNTFLGNKKESFPKLYKCDIVKHWISNIYKI